MRTTLRSVPTYGVIAVFLSTLAMVGCQEPPVADRGYIASDKASSTAAAVASNSDTVGSKANDNPIYRGLITKQWSPESVPKGYRFGSVEPQTLNQKNIANGAVGKVTFKLKGPYEATILSYTIYPTTAQAVAAFATIGEVPASWNQLRTEKLPPPGLEGTVWGEDSYERYGSGSIVRTSVATIVNETVSLAQIVNPGETPREGVHDDAIALLKFAVAHVQQFSEKDAAAATADDASKAVKPDSATTP